MFLFSFSILGVVLGKVVVGEVCVVVVVGLGGLVCLSVLSWCVRLVSDVELLFLVSILICNCVCSFVVVGRVVRLV